MAQDIDSEWGSLKDYNGRSTTVDMNSFNPKKPPNLTPVKPVGANSSWYDPSMQNVNGAGINAASANLDPNLKNLQAPNLDQSNPAGSWDIGQGQYGQPGTGIPGFGQGGQGQNPFERSRWGLAYGEDPNGLSAWGNAQMNKLGMQGQEARDKLAQGSAAQLGTGLSSIARQGGLNSGARERQMGLSGYNEMMGNQQIGMKQAQMGQDIAANDYTGRVNRGLYDDQIEATDRYVAGMQNLPAGKTMGDMGTSIWDKYIKPATGLGHVEKAVNTARGIS